MAPTRKQSVGIVGTPLSQGARWMLVSAVFAIGLIAMVSFTYLVASLDAAEKSRRLDDTLEYHATALRTEIARIAAIEHATRSFFAASREVEAHEFALFASSLLKQFKDLNSVVWVPQIEAEDVDEHGREAIARGLENYTITGIDGAPVTRSTTLFPTWYIAHQDGASLVPLGFDWGAIPPVLTAMIEARDAGTIVAAGSLESWLQPEGRTLSVLVAPVFSTGRPTGSVADRRVATEGFIVVVVWLDALLEQVATVHGNEPRGISLHLLDVTEPNAPYRLADYPAGRNEAPSVSELMALSQNRPSTMTEVAMAGRVWQLVGVSLKPDSLWSANVIGASVGGFFIALLLAMLVWFVVSHIGKGEVDRLQAISSSASDGIITSDEAGNITSFNAAATAMFGKSADELLGQPLTMLMPERFRAAHRRGFKRFVSTSEAKIVGKGPIDLIGLRDDGCEFPIELALGTWRTAGGKPNFAAVVRDTSSRQGLEQELTQAKELAEAASQAKSEFLAKMSHELRTPLNAIVGICDLLGDAPLTSSQHADLEQINRSADSLLRLVSDILDLSRIEAGQLELASNSFSLRTVVEDSVQPLIRRAQVKNLEMTCRVAPDIPDALIGDSGRLQQILLNIVGNAVKFTDEGVVQVNVESTRNDDGRVELEFSVRDTGPGIPPNYREKIFGLFVQGEAGPMHAEGVGLGLATASQLVQMMGGRIRLDSEVGEGSCFSFTVDVGLDANATAPEFAEGGLEGTRVLIVDDNPLSRQVLKELTESWGMWPESAVDGATGLARLRAAAEDGKRIRLLLLDNNLPDMGGMEVAKAISEDASLPKVPCILMSAGPDGEEEAKAREVGIEARLAKPVSRSNLLEAIEKSLRLQPALIASRAMPQVARVPLNVLLAEDNPVNATVIRRMLTHLGHRVQSVENGQEAVDAVAREGFDVVLMDYDMPVMNGLDAAMVIRAREKETAEHLQLLALTAYAMEEDRTRLLEAGMDAVVTKPVRMETLAKVLNDIAENLPAKTPSESASAAASPPQTDERIPEPIQSVADAAATETPAKSPAEVAPQAEAPILDIGQLGQLGYSESILEIIGMLETQLPELEARIGEAIEAQDASRLRLASHTLKGSLALFGAARASEAAKRLEEMGRGGSLEGAADALDDLRTRLGELRAALGPIREQLALRIQEDGAASPVAPTTR